MRKRILTAAVAAATLASGAQAAGFYLKEQSVVGQGRAFAGSAAGTDGASAAYFNPAGIVGLERQIEVGVHYIKPDVTVTNNGTSYLDLSSVPPINTNFAFMNGTKNTVEPYSGKPVPNMHAVLPMNDELTLGIAVGAPYGFSNDYGTDSFTRGDHIKVDFSSIETSFSVAKMVSDKTSLSVGLMVQMLELDQDKLAANGTVTKLKGDSTDYGFVLGMQHKPSEDMTIGASYRSQVTHTVDGTLGTTPVTAPFQLPDIFMLGVSHNMSDTTRLYADATWYGWSAYKTQMITSKTGTNISEIESNYSNTVSFGLGVEHDYEDGLTARAGIMVDPTPTNDTDRTTASPDSDRTWLSAGLSKKMSDQMDVDFALTHIMADNTKVNKAVKLPLTSGGVQVGTVRANVKGSTNIVSLGFRYKF
jgi:long-chain fatty acid transport protein